NLVRRRKISESWIRRRWDCGKEAPETASSLTLKKCSTESSIALPLLLSSSPEPSPLHFSSKGQSFDKNLDLRRDVTWNHNNKVDVIMDKIRCRPKGFAYVTFSSKEDAEKALLELNGQLVDGRVVILDTTKAVKQNRRESKLEHAGGDK
ncbi:unnamed protein product, partial [Thlaspi arvense]